MNLSKINDVNQLLELLELPKFDKANDLVSNVELLTIVNNAQGLVDRIEISVEYNEGSLETFQFVLNCAEWNSYPDCKKYMEWNFQTDDIDKYKSYRRAIIKKQKAIANMEVPFTIIEEPEIVVINKRSKKDDRK